MAKLHIACSVNKEIVKALTQSPFLSNVKSLFIDRQSSSEALKFLTKSCYLTNLISLEICHSTLDEEMVTCLVSSPNLKNLEILELTNCNISNQSFQAIVTSPYLTRLKKLNVVNSNITASSIHFLYQTTLSSLESLSLANNKGLKGNAGVLLANWPGLRNLKYLDLTKSLGKKSREVLSSSRHLQAQVEGVPEYSNSSNWRHMKQEVKVIAETMSILGKRTKIIKEVEKQISIWAQKFKITLTFNAKNPGICIDITAIGKNVLTKSQKEHGEPDVSDTIYAVALLEEAKRKIADKHQQHITKIYFS